MKVVVRRFGIVLRDRQHFQTPRLMPRLIKAVIFILINQLTATGNVKTTSVSEILAEAVFIIQPPRLTH